MGGSGLEVKEHLDEGTDILHGHFTRLTLFTQSLGDTAVREIANVKAEPARDFEIGAFEAANRSRTLIIFPNSAKGGQDDEKGFAGEGTPQPLRRVTVPGLAAYASANISATVFTAQGPRPFQAEQKIVPNAQGTIQLPDNFALKSGETLLIQFTARAR